ERTHADIWRRSTGWRRSPAARRTPPSPPGPRPARPKREPRCVTLRGRRSCPRKSPPLGKVGVGVIVVPVGRDAPDAVLVARKGDAVDAAVAIHARLAREGLGVAFERQVGDARVGAEMGDRSNVDVGMFRGPPVGLLA